MTESEARADSSKYNEGTKEKQQIHEERNTAQNWAPLQAARKEGRARDIKDEPQQVGKPPCVIVSSGPSLDDHIAKLRAWKGGVMCSTSHATTLMYHGVEPTHIVVLDPFCNWGEISGVDWSKTKTKLIVNPSVWPDIIERWPNDMLLFLQNIGRRDSFYATTQMHMFCDRVPDDPTNRTPNFVPWIRTELTLFACTPPAQIFCADILGYGPCFLFGCDFANSPTLGRFTRLQPNVTGAWVTDRSPFTPGGPEDIVMDNGAVSSEHMLYYKKNFISAWRLSRQQLYSCDRWTSMPEVPAVDADEVIAKQGLGFAPLAKEDIIERTEGYLARVGAYIIQRPDDAVSFVESADPLNDLPRYMAEGRKQWRCKKCGMQVTANVTKETRIKPRFKAWLAGVLLGQKPPTEADLTGAKCPKCGTDGFARVADCDIVANMVRIKGLVAKAEEFRLHKGTAGHNEPLRTTLEQTGA